MSESIIAKRSFTSDDIIWFAAASGDWNPVHVNSVHARRLLTGKQVVHGMFTLLWALEEYCSKSGEPMQSIAANFLQPVGVGDPLLLLKEEVELDCVRLVIRCKGDDVLTVLLTTGGKHTDARPILDRPSRVSSENNTFSELKHSAGNITVIALQEDLIHEFSHAEQVMGSMPIASLLTLSRLVGMKCPGLHSLYTGLDININHSKNASEIDWSVIRHSVSHAPLRLSIDGGCIAGHLDAFVRPAPVSQVDIEKIAEDVKPTIFNKQVALVVGGSRGLGELTAKIVAAGGGHSVITYHQGNDDAERVKEEIIGWGGQCSVIQLDAEHPEAAIKNLNNMSLIPTHVYYFASPRIAMNKGDDFNLDLWRMFSSIFVEGFARVINCVKETYGTNLAAFYPSTVYIDEQLQEFSEYISAKTAGEKLCAHMTKHINGLQVLVKRLPRMPTDQTAGLIRLPTSEPLPWLLEVVTEMQTSTIKETEL
jgi:hypothetical protein